MPARCRPCLVAVALAALAAGCDAGEPRALHLRIVIDPAVPAFDAVDLSVASLRDGEDLRGEQLQLRPADFDAARSCTLVLFITPEAELVEAQADARAGASTVGHGRRSVTTLAGRDYDLEVTVLPKPRF